jgi:phosphatidylglycerophosphate synthase
MQVKQKPQNCAQLRTNAQVAIILANSTPWSEWFEPTLAPVGTLPVLLRTILGVQSTHLERIVVVVNRDTGPQIRLALTRTRRVPDTVEWLEADPETSLSSIVRWATANSCSASVLLVAGDRTYLPALHRMVSEWEGHRGVLELATGSEPVGLFALSHEAALELGADHESNVSSVRDMHRWITQKAISNGPSFIEFRLVEENSWQRISMPQDCVLAEQKLNRWLVKPTDGVFARMNRRISIPISRQLIKFPITPNMVSLFTLGVSIAAGAFFALGGYWNTLLGAILSVWASILDGCDGEVARLKLQASDFGCWLETACDYLYYLLIFAGMTIGLARNSGNRAYWAWGGALLFGAAFTILLAWFERSRLSGKHPEQFLATWQKKAESRLSNPLMYLGRHCEFIIRRCFLPYALLAFALLNLTWLALYMSAIGANIAWIISLYSRFAFSAKSRTTKTSSAAQEMKPINV